MQIRFRVRFLGMLTLDTADGEAGGMFSFPSQRCSEREATQG